jgi:hypothetical protein
VLLLLLLLKRDGVDAQVQSDAAVMGYGERA